MNKMGLGLFPDPFFRDVRDKRGQHKNINKAVTAHPRGRLRPYLYFYIARATRAQQYNVLLAAKYKYKTMSH
jgi:hypothetical protein